MLEDFDAFQASLAPTIRAGAGNDNIRIDTSGNVPHVTNIVYGEAGNDRIFAEALGFHNDGVTEATAVNRISGGDGHDQIEAIALGADEWASVGTNVVSGDAGNDTIRGEAAHANTLSGGIGDDTIRATLTENYTATPGPRATTSMAVTATTSSGHRGGLRYGTCGTGRMKSRRCS